MNITASSPPHFLLCDDEAGVLLGASLLLRRSGFDPVSTLQDSRQVLPFLAQNSVAMVMLDLHMPHIGGLQLLGEIKQLYPDLPVVILTAMQDVKMAVACMKEGAMDYLLKPIEKERLLAIAEQTRQLYSLRRQVDTLKGYLLNDPKPHQEAFAGIVTNSTRMRSIFQYMEAIATTREPVLITGETGVGKESIAAAMHHLSGRSGAFVPVNVAGLDDMVFSDTLFGHRKGAYTGADQNRDGQIAKAVGGTLFLDEIGDLSETSQVKLLRLLQEKKYFPLGSDIGKHADIYVVAATNRAIKERILNGHFRADLYYRLAGHQVHLPPLRERVEDIALLVNHFLQDAARSVGKEPPTPTPELFSLLSSYSFPGNIRELRAMVFDAVAQHRRGVLSLRSFKEHILATQGYPDPTVPPHDALAQCGPQLSWPHTARPPTIKEAEEFLLHNALRASKGNQGVAASLLGITRQALNQRLARRKKGHDEMDASSP
ncbi:MAG: sigma-54-dependent Fis family transcriptional regulator [Magnetococcales bacterium]|nr:sigma-54-dependent Fis family transcriptional regulator [Magnetococcales bacterium]MBF0114968.1 sigma-54-dependent Fis family transcriptional regulator [Magnetococcales bacterium]